MQKSLNASTFESTSIGKKLDRIILHLDLDCFYCQVESVRLGIPSNVPLVVQQWATAIAVNYAARAAQVQRHSSYQECLAKCPEIRFVHVPTYSTTQPGVLTYYRDTGREDTQVPDRTVKKASLQPYRGASAKVFACIRATLSEYETAFIMEKASVDEVYIDVSEIVDRLLIQKYGWHIQRGRLLSEIESFDDLLASLQWEECGHPVLTNFQDTNRVNPIADLRIYFGTMIAKRIREVIFQELKYTVSAGIATNKTLAKLASALNKPNQQTYVRSCVVQEWMKHVPFQKIRFLGGKLGKRLLRTPENKQYITSDNEEEDKIKDSEDEGEGEREHLNAIVQEPTTPTDANSSLTKSTEEGPVMAADLWSLSIEDLARRLGELEVAKWAYNVIRGSDTTPVAPHLHAKSFMSIKNLYPPIRQWTEIHDWLVLLITELSARLQEEFLVNQRWPQSLTLYFKRPQEKLASRTMDLPFEHDQLTDSTHIMALTELCFSLLSAEHKGSPIFPCDRLAVSATRMRHVMEGPLRKKTLTLDSFLKSQNKVSKTESPNSKSLSSKKRNLTDFLQSGNHDTIKDSFRCSRCSMLFDAGDKEGIEEHNDFHFAMELQKQLDAQTQ